MLLVASLSHIIKSVRGAWEWICYRRNKIANIFQCVLSSIICVQNFIWIEWIVSKLWLIVNIQKTNNPSCDVIICTESAIHVSSLLRLQTHITLQLKEITYNSPIGLFFSCSFKWANKNFCCQCPLRWKYGDKLNNYDGEELKGAFYNKDLIHG